MKYFTTALLVLTLKIVFPQAQYYLCFDKTLSEVTGAENIISIHKAIYDFEDKYLPTKFMDENSGIKKLGGISYRLGKSFVNYNISYIAGLAQHEAFGHGSRLREFGYTESSYHLSFPHPLGKGNGYAQGAGPYGRKVSNYENCAILFGGMEGESVIANTLRTKWLLNNSISNPEVLLYISGRHNITAYILNTNYKTFKTSHPNSGDVVNYLSSVNNIYGYNPNSSSYNINFLSQQAFVTLLDPLTYIAAYDYLVSYTVKGDEENNIPMIRFGKIRYLPSFRLGLSPFGSEFYSEHMAIWNKKVVELYYRQSDGTFAQTYGGGFKLSHLINNKYLIINTSFDLWNQPKMQLGGNKLYYTEGGLGGAIGVTAIIDLLTRDHSVGVMMNATYKTAGYLEGEKLAQGPIVRVGLAFTESNNKNSK